MVHREYFTDTARGLVISTGPTSPTSWPDTLDHACANSHRLQTRFHGGSAGRSSRERCSLDRHAQDVAHPACRASPRCTRDCCSESDSRRAACSAVGLSFPSVGAQFDAGVTLDVGSPIDSSESIPSDRHRRVGPFLPVERFASFVCHQKSREHGRPPTNGITPAVRRQLTRRKHPARRVGSRLSRQNQRRSGPTSCAPMQSGGSILSLDS